MKHDPLFAVRSDLLIRIEKLQRDCAILSIVRLCDQLEEIRGIARLYQMEPIERLASLLGSVVAYNGHRQVALTYLSLMHDAAEGEAVDPAASHVFLAAAALRGCRPSR
jgi:hypothetical protein